MNTSIINFNTLDFCEQVCAISRNPELIKDIENPSLTIQNHAVNADGLLIRYIKEPSYVTQMIALYNNPDALKYIDNPCYEIQRFAQRRAKDIEDAFYN